jgi:hypothetical protein
VIVGLAAGGVGIWFMRSAQPEPGAPIDRIHDEQNHYTVAIVREAHSDHAFLEWKDDRTGDHWEALIPPYAGAPGTVAVATSATAVSVRVVRDRPELWVFATEDSTKLGSISLDGYAPGGWDPKAARRSAVVTAGDGLRGFEVIDGKTGTAIVAIDLSRGSVLWHREFPGPISEVRILPDRRIEVASSSQRLGLDPVTGRE